MFATPTPDSLWRMRKLLQLLEAYEPCHDRDTVETIKNLVRNHIRALEVVGDLASKPSKLPQNREP